MSAVLLPDRWISHRRDVCVVLEVGEPVRFVARDVLEALGQDLAGYSYATDAGCPTTVAGVTLREHATAATWSLGGACEIIATLVADGLVEPGLAGDLVAWLSDRAGAYERIGISDVVRASTPPVRPAPAPVVPARREWWTVQEAAELLGRDPAIAIGQNRLFEWMHSRGWVTKREEQWVPEPMFVATVGYLVTVDERLRRRFSSVYPRVCVTEAGMRALHRHLGGVAELHLSDDQPLLMAETAADESES